MEEMTVTLSEAQFKQLTKMMDRTLEKWATRDTHAFNQAVHQLDIDRKRAELINSECYLYTINEARRLMRMNRERFVNEFIKSGKIPITKIDKRDMIAFMDLRNFLKSNKYIYKQN